MIAGGMPHGKTRPPTASTASARHEASRSSNSSPKGTLEEKIDAMITKKAALMNSIVESDDAMFKAFSRKELIELLTF